MAVTTTTWSGPVAADAPGRSNPENSHSKWTNLWGLDNSTQTLPGNLTQVTTYDEGGEPTQLQYRGQVTPVTEGTDPDTGETIYIPGTPIQNQPWITWSLDNDITGRVRTEATGVGAAFDNGQGVATIDDVANYADAIGQASSYSREYSYDRAGRLTHVTDAATSLDPTTGDPVPTCTERAYTFDANGRRTQLAATTHPGGDCAATGTTTATATTGWDTADRPTTGRGGVGSYVYDLLGRQTTLPAADAPINNGNITLGYYDDDLPKSIAQGTTTTTFTLDADSRRSVQTTTDPSGTVTTTRRYTGGSDNPAWSDTTTSAGTTTTRYAESIGGDLSATIDDTIGAPTRGDAALNLANTHGDVVTTVTVPATNPSSTPATTITGWATYDEYGTANGVDPVDGPLGYGWLGGKQRSTTAATVGLTLMGVRLYNPIQGTFTSMDPIAQSNESGWGYPSDPLNLSDTSGQRPDAGGDRPSFLTREEWEAWNKKQSGFKYDAKAFARAKRKFDKAEKFAGERNNAKRKGRFRKGGRGFSFPNLIFPFNPACIVYKSMCQKDRFVVAATGRKSARKYWHRRRQLW